MVHHSDAHYHSTRHLNTGLDGGLNNRPFYDQTTFDHSNTGYSDILLQLLHFL